MYIRSLYYENNSFKNVLLLIFKPYFNYGILRIKQTCCKSDNLRYVLPAVDVNNYITHERHQHTHACHYVSQIVPVYIHTGNHAYKCTASTGHQSCHVESINDRNFFHVKRNSRKSEEENNRINIIIRLFL